MPAEPTFFNTSIRNKFMVAFILVITVWGIVNATLLEHALYPILSRQGVPSESIELIARQFITVSTGLTIIGILVFLLIALFFAKTIAKPLMKLNDGVMRIDRGELNVRIERSSHDELGQLADSINKMVAALQKSTRELAIANEELKEEVAERQRAEEELRKAKEAAEFASSAKGEFLANMSHEIRTPLNAIIGLADLLNETRLSAEQEEYVQIYQRSGENLLTLLNDILDLSKIEAGRLELESIAFDLLDLVDKTVEIQAVSAQAKGLKLNYRLAPGVPRLLQGDAIRLQQILANLLGNAVKFTENGGVMLEVDVAEHYSDSSLLRFAVSDTGIGIPVDKLHSVFDSFTQAAPSTTRKYGGTGLGLAIAKRLVEAMGGRIHVDSTVGGGSTFCFSVCFARLQLLSVNLANTSNEAEPLPPPPTEFKLVAERPLRVLLAEDSEDNALLIKSYLKQTPHTVDLAKNGLQALAKYIGGGYDLVLMDMQMPEMDGYTATSRIRAWEAETGLPPTPIVALTAYARQEDMAKSLAAGCTVHICKPLKKGVLLKAINNFAGGAV